MTKGEITVSPPVTGASTFEPVKPDEQADHAAEGPHYDALDEEPA